MIISVSFLIQSWLFIVLIYSIGHVLFFFANNNYLNNAESFFRKIVTGFTTIVCLYAVIKTRCNSQLLGVFLIYSIYLFWHKKITFKFIPINKNDYKYLFLFLLTFTIFFFLNYYLDDIKNNIVHKDLLFYSNLSEYLNRFGIESKSHNFYDFNNQQPMFYHYFNEWFTALYSYIFKHKTILSYVFFIQPFYHAVTYLGILSITCRYINNKWKYLLPFTFFFITNIGHIIINYGNDIYWSSNLIESLPSKILIISIFFIIFILNRNDITNKILPLSLVSIIYVTTLPALLCTWISIIIIDSSIRKKLLTIDYITILLPLIYIVFFYFLNSIIHPKISSDFSYLQQFIYYISHGMHLKIYIGIIYNVIICAIIAYFPYIFFYKTIKNYIHNFYFIFYIFLIFWGGVGYLLLQHTLDGYQVFTNITTAITPIYIYILIVIRLTTIKHNKSDIIIYILLISLTIHHYLPKFKSNNSSLPQEEFKEVINSLNKDYDLRFAFIYNSETYLKDIYYYYHYLSIPYCYFSLYTKLYQPTSLSLFDQPIKESNSLYHLYKEVDNSKIQSPFYNYVITKSYKDIDLAKLDFIKDNKIDVLIIEKNNVWFYNHKQYLPIQNCFFNDSNFKVFLLNWEQCQH